MKTSNDAPRSVENDAKIMQEIKKMLKESQRERKERQGEIVKKVATPYGIYNGLPPKQGKSKGVSTVSTRLYRSQSGNGSHGSKVSSRSLAETDELLRQYVDEMSENKDGALPPDEFKVKSMTLMHADTMMKVSTFLEADLTSFRSKPALAHTDERPSRSEKLAALQGKQKPKLLLSKPVSSPLAAPAPSLEGTSTATKLGEPPAKPTGQQKLRYVSATKFSKKYSRFCQGLQFSDQDLQAVGPRTDCWIVKFMEICYDDAYNALNMVSSSSGTKPTTLELGGLDAFPLLVQRNINKIYSMMDIRKTTCLELLYTLELVMEKSERLRFSKPLSTKQIADADDGQYDSGRAVLFSKFLSEEYDVEMLLLFLHSREKLEGLLGRKMKHINPTRIWMSANARTPADLSSVLTGDVALDKYDDVSALALKKVVPYSLPANWVFLDDISLPEAPLLAVQMTLLPHILHVMFGKLEPDVKDYLTQKVFYLLNKDKVRSSMPITSLDTSALLSTSAHTTKTVTSISQSSTAQSSMASGIECDARSIPIYTVLRSLCAEYKKLSNEEKSQFTNSNAMVESLQTLNEIYSNNNALAKEHEKTISTVQNRLTMVTAKIAQLEKQLKRMNKVWQNKMNINDNGQVQVFDQIEQLTEDLLEAQSSREELDALLKRSKQAFAEHNAHANHLWHQATMPSNQFRSKGKKVDIKVPGYWRQYIQHMAGSAFRFNLKQYLLMKDVIKQSVAATNEQVSNLAPVQINNFMMTNTTAGVIKDGTSDVRFLIVQTLSKLFVRNVLRSAVHKVKLQKQLAYERHFLLLQYGSDDYRLKELERQQQLELQQKLAYQDKIRRIVIRGLVNDLVPYQILPPATSNAFHALYDTFYYLALDLSEYINARLLAVADRMHNVAVSKRHGYVYSKVFNRISEPWRCKKVKALSDRLVCKRVFRYLYDLHFMHKCKSQMITRLQRYIRCCVYSIRFRKHMEKVVRANSSADSFLVRRQRFKQLLFLKHWMQETADHLALRKCESMINERNFLKGFYTWLHVFKMRCRERRYQNEDRIRKCVIIQRNVRGCFTRKRIEKYKSRLCIFHAIRNFQARKILASRLQRKRLQLEFTHHLSRQCKWHCMKRTLKHWRYQYAIHKGYMLLSWIDKRYKESKRFGRWQAIYEDFVRSRNYNLILIQAVVRMFLVHRKVLKYYHWRPKFVRMQAVVRGFVQWRRYQVMIFFHRKVVIIQKHARRFVIMRYIQKLRTAQIHKDAADNNYGKIKFYLENYRDMLLELDDQGNTVLHIAASYAAKRVLKLLIKAQLFDNINLYNQKTGYTPLHMLIMSTSAFRDECCLYFIERGFDDDLYTLYENRSCLLLAVLFNSTEIASRFIDDGHDVNVFDNDNLTCLQSACYNGNAVLVKMLLDNGADVTAQGYADRYAIHDAVLSGNVDVLYALMAHPGLDLGITEDQQSQTPLMFACINSQAACVQALLVYHNQQTDEPLLRRRKPKYAGSSLSTISSQSVQKGSLDIRPTACDMYGRTAVHHAAMCPDTAVLDLLRSADMELETADSQGNTPLHLSTLHHSYNNVKYLLEAGVYPSCQNEDGDQPVHIAARFDEFVNILALLCQYDDNLGRLNYAHQSPWAVAQFHSAIACLAYLQQNFSRLDFNLAVTKARQETPNVLFNKTWDAEIDTLTQGYVCEIAPSGERSFVNTFTGERSFAPPVIASSSMVQAKAQELVKLPVQRTVRMVTDDDLQQYDNKYSAVNALPSTAEEDVYGSDNIVLSKFNYKDEFAAQKAEIQTISIHYYNATTIVKFARRKLAYLKIRRMKAEKRAKRHILIFFKRHLAGFMEWKKILYFTAARKIQSVYRGRLVRKSFFDQTHIVTRYFVVCNNRHEAADYVPSAAYFHQLEGQFYILRHKFYQRRLYRLLSRAYKYYKARSDYRIFQHILKRLPKMTIKDWGEVIKEAKWPLRTVGFYEEYAFPGSRRLVFYRHTMTGQCAFQKPRKLIYLDETVAREQLEIATYGATLKQIELVRKLQALWRGFSIRTYYTKVEKAVEISQKAEESYLLHPEKDIFLYNYALYLLTFPQDINHCRTVFTECLRRMQYHGPDVAFVLYAYCIYAMASHDENIEDILALRQRAQEAERLQIETQRAKQMRAEKMAGIVVETKRPGSTKASKLRSTVQQSRQAEEATPPVGKTFDLAHVGFFRYTAVLHSNHFGYELLAICRFLVYDDFSLSFKYFMEAFHYAPENSSLMENFNLMMAHYHGKNKEVRDNVIKSKMRQMAQADADQEEVRRILRERAQRRVAAANTIRRWYRERRAARLFGSFMVAVSDTVSVARSHTTTPGSKNRKHRSRGNSRQ